MLTQIYEVSSAQEAAAISEMGVDHIGVLVGDGSFPREQPLASAVEIAASIRRPSKLSALFLSSDLAYVVRTIRELEPAIVHLGAAPELVTPEHVLELKRVVPEILVMRSVPVVGLESIDIAQRYRGNCGFPAAGQLQSRMTSKSGRSASPMTGASAGRSSRGCAHLSFWPVGSARTMSPRRSASFVPPASTRRRKRTGETRTRKDLEKVRLFERAAKQAAE